MRFAIALLVGLVFGVIQAQTLDFQRSHVPPQMPVGIEEYDSSPYQNGWVFFGKVGRQGILMRFDRMGNQIAVRRFFAPFSGGIDHGKIVVNEATGDIWVAYTNLTYSTKQVTVQKFNGSLTLQTTVNLDRGGDDQYPDICLGPSNSVFVAFHREPAPVGLTSLELVRLEANGTQTFTNNYSQDVLKNHYPRQVVYDPLFQNVYVTASINNFTATNYLVVSRFSPTTGQLIANYFPYTESSTTGNILREMTLTADGIVRVSGESYVSGGVQGMLFELNPNNGYSSNTFHLGADDVYENALDSFGTNFVMLTYVGPNHRVRFNGTEVATPTQSAFEVKHFGTASRFAVSRDADSNSQREIAQVYSPSTGLLGTIRTSSFSRRGRQLTRIGTDEMVVTTSNLNDNTEFFFAQFNSSGQKALEYTEYFTGQGQLMVAGSIVDRDCAYVAYRTSFNTSQLRLMKVNSSGAVAWDRSIPGETTSVKLAVNADRDVAVLTDQQGANRSYVIVIDDQFSGTLWSKIIEGSPSGGLAFASDGSLYSATTRINSIYSTSDFHVVKFSPTGSILWTRTYDGGTLEDRASQLAVTPSGYVVVSGVAFDFSSTRAFALVVLDSNGNFHWTPQFVLPGNPEVDEIAMQPNGLITYGYRYFDNGIYKIRVQRIDPVRKQILADSTFAGSNNVMDFGIASSPAGTAYLAQASETSRGLVQFNSSGAVAWVKTLPSGVSTILDVTTDAQNSVYVLANELYTDSAGGRISGLYFVKYNTLGQLVSDRRIRGTGVGLNVYASKLEMGSVFDVWVTSSFSTVNNPEGMPTVTRYLQPVAPSVLGETYTVVKGQTLTIAAPGVLANDSDLNGDSITCTILSNPAQGTLTLQNNGAFSYVAPSTAGTRNFKYTVRDSTGRSSIAQCNINVTN
jgi:hypothetical protein